MKESEKAMRYEAKNPGVDISPEQKAERYDRAMVKEKYRGVGRRRRRSIVGCITVPHNSTCWCECGRLNGHEGKC